jgi:NAD-dependent DNA ligase
MPSEKLTRILKAKSPFNPDQIAAMSESDGWNWVYTNAAPRKDKLIQVCFTGFSASDKASLTVSAVESQLAVVTSVTKDLAFLCAGENAGPAKLSKAKSQGVTVLTRQQFEHLLATGEVAA